MTSFFASVFTFFLSWWGLVLLGALDSSMLFFLPLAIDAAVVILTARQPDLFWLYPALATAGSLAGGLFTFWVGEKLGEQGLERFVSGRRLTRLKSRVRERGAVAMALPALFPPPFPFTPFILTSGALDVSRSRFFVTMFAARAARFGTEAVLARAYGSRILRWMESDTFQVVVGLFAALAIGGTVYSILRLLRGTGSPPPRPAPAG